VSWTLCKAFEAKSLEEALKIAEEDDSDDWQEFGDPETSFYLGEKNA